jgi:uncharacterized protein YecE (DUF72 family)
MARGVARLFRMICPSKDSSILRPTVPNDRTQRRILSHTDCRSHSRLGRTDARRLHICLEGLQIHYDTSRNSLALLEERLGPLVKKAGPVLFQFPSQFERTARASPLLEAAFSAATLCV